MLLDKKQTINETKKGFYNKTLSMFHYENLPETLPYIELEKLLQVKGYAFITNKFDGELYAFDGALSGQQDVYGNYKEVIISNPLFQSKTLELNKDCVMVKNDDLCTGLEPLYRKNAIVLTESDLSLMLANYNSRIQTLISANDDNTIESAKEYLDKLIDGEIGVIAESKLFDSLKVNNKTVSGLNVSQLIELQQYLKANVLNEIGLNANYNMKRERLNTSEVEMNTDNLYPFIENMLNNRIQGIEKVNELFGTSIEIEFSNVWKLTHSQLQSNLDSLDEEQDEQEEQQVEQDEQEEKIEGEDSEDEV